ncbi:DUF6286 domain-containing protein [Nocardiopsis sp. B62]|uniref:DUF6286 domain-containing protein n=1 Tax=Nocardiopsis sp. B62 TaxID=2824874 RepID=UPI001B37AB63|nr:DUF6286 domain-containing protein [Nocardiopsis sp. B62]MBQ1081898.1 hypothetical protein [Nocardiopsis sp. B62]
MVSAPLSVPVIDPEAGGPAGVRPAAPGPDARAARRVAVRTFRPRRSTAAVLVSSVTALVAGVAAAEVIAALVGSPLRILPLERVAEPTAGVHWDGPEMLAASAVTAVVGLFLLLTALVPGKGSHMVLRTDDRDLVVGLSRRGLRHLAETTAREVAGVTGAHARVRRRTVRITARVPTPVDPGLRARVEDRVRGRLLELDPTGPVRVRARLRRVEGGLR